jgi:riboflavin transporter FmnP
MSSKKTRNIVRIGVLGAIASVLFYFPEIEIIPPIYKLDFSTLPALLGGFSMGPAAGVWILLIKAVTGLLHSSSMGVGELADFLMSAALVVPAALWYGKRRTMRGALTGMLMGILLMTAVGALANYYVLIPFYRDVMGLPIETIIQMIAATIPPVDTTWKLILMATTPFNLIKGIVLCGITALLYKRLSPLLHA